MKHKERAVHAVLGVCVVMGCATTGMSAPQPGEAIEDPEILERLVAALECPAEEVFAESWFDAAVAEGCGRHAHLGRDVVSREWRDQVTLVELASGEAIPWNRGMTRPRKVSGRDPHLPGALRLGPRPLLSLVRCVIDTEGIARDCRILKPTHPELDEEIVQAINASSYEPVTYRGRRVAVHYVFATKVSGPQERPQYAPAPVY